MTVAFAAVTDNLLWLCEDSDSTGNLHHNLNTTTVDRAARALASEITHSSFVVIIILAAAACQCCYSCTVILCRHIGSESGYSVT